jgi:MFS family permease
VRPLRERNFRLLFLGRTISFFGTNLVPIALAFAVLDLTGSASDLGIVFAARTLAQIATLLVGGVVADRLPRQLVMIGSDSASFGVQLVMGTLLVTGHATLWELVALQLVGGAAAAFHSPASAGLVPQTVPAEALQEANALVDLARYAATVGGVAAGGALVATVGSGWAIALDAATYATSAALLSRMRLPLAARTAGAPNFVRELREGWGAFTAQTWIWLLTLYVALYFLITYSPFFVLGPAIAKESLGGSTAWAIVLTADAVGALIGCLFALRWRPRRPMAAIGVIFAVSALQVAMLAAGAPLALLASAAALAGFAFSTGSIVFETSVQENVPRHQLSRVSAYNWMGAMVFLPAGYALAGPVADLIGRATYLWAGVVWLLASTAAVLAVPSVRNFQSRAAGVSAAVPAATTP